MFFISICFLLFVKINLLKTMKKIFFLFSFSLLVLASCSNDDNSTTDSVTSILPKTVIYTYPSYPSENSISTFVYNGNKIVSSKNEIGRTDYTYDGNVIVKATGYVIVSGKDVKSYEGLYTYLNNKLTTYSYAEGFTAQFPEGQRRGRSVYTYNSDGTVKRESYSTDTTTGIEYKGYFTTVSTFVSGNLVKAVTTSEAPGSNYVSTDVYEYDSKKNPLRNVLGFNLLLDDKGKYSVNNIVKHTTSSVNGPGVPGPYVYQTEYAYDTNGYPTKATVYQKDGVTIDGITEYIY